MRFDINHRFQDNCLGGDEMELFTGPNPWPEIRKKRIDTLLPPAMKLAGVDAWLILCRENANDPLAAHIGGENAGATAAFLFQLQNGGVRSTVFCPWGEAVGLKELGLHDHVVVMEQPNQVWSDLAQHLQQLNPQRIAVNCSHRAVADGLSWNQRQQLEQALGPDLSARLVSADDLVSEWLSVKLPEEVDIMAKAGKLTVQIQLEAYKTIVPGKTRDKDVAQFIQKTVEELNLGYAWAPSHNPSVNSGFPRGHASASNKIIEPGDFIQTDFGIKVYDTWCTDYQRFAYVLAPGETKPPAAALDKWQKAVSGQRKALAAMKPGVKGVDVDLAQRHWMEEAGSLPVMWGTGHPVGYWAHDIGPALTGGQRPQPPADALRPLRVGQTFAFDGFFCWQEERSYGSGQRLISVEEMAVVTPEGARYLIPPQQDLILIPSP